LMMQNKPLLSIASQQLTFPCRLFLFLLFPPLFI
jgi:hypothetical protein